MNAEPTPSANHEPAPQQFIALDELHPSPTNPRKHFDQTELEELATSIGRHGVLQPLVVRPRGRDGFEIICGERRFRAARLAQLPGVPAVVRKLTDVEVLEIQLVENLQRTDLGPLEEAEGYRLLIKTGKYDHKRIASRIGRSEKYVYDRIKLLELIPPVKKLVGEEKLNAGVAIQLARLKPADQARALKEAVFEEESLLFGPGDRVDARKARSVREVAGWIDCHVRFDAAAPDPVLFPDTAAAIATAEEGKGKIIPITHAQYVHPDARGRDKIYGPRSWKRADGEQKSKTCERSGTGVVVAGWRRGESFAVCVSKTCPVHFPAQARRAKPQRAASAAGPAAAAAPKAPTRRPMGDDEILSHFGDDADQAVCAAAAKATAATVMRLIATQNHWWTYDAAKTAGLKIPGARGDQKKTLEFVMKLDLPRLQTLLIAQSLETERDCLLRFAATLGVELRDATRKARVRAFAARPDAYTGVCRECGCVDADACVSPDGELCSWTDKEHTKCSACFPSEPAPAKPSAGRKPAKAKPKKRGKK